jgi:hypothetical protein
MGGDGDGGHQSGVEGSAPLSCNGRRSWIMLRSRLPATQIVSAACGDWPACLQLRMRTAHFTILLLHCYRAFALGTCCAWVGRAELWHARALQNESGNTNVPAFLPPMTSSVLILQVVGVLARSSWLLKYESISIWMEPGFDI